MQAVVQRKFRANQFETDPEKIEKFKGEYDFILEMSIGCLLVCFLPRAFKSLNTIFKMLLSQEYVP